MEILNKEVKRIMPKQNAFLCKLETKHRLEIYQDRLFTVQYLSLIHISNGLGWQTDILSSKRPECKNIIFYPGSSVYDTAQMSRFIDLLVQEARNLDIETLPPEKLEAMKLEWK